MEAIVPYEKVPEKDTITNDLKNTVCDMVYSIGKNNISTRATLLSHYVKEKPKSSDSGIVFWDINNSKWDVIELSQINRFSCRLKKCSGCEEFKPFNGFGGTKGGEQIGSRRNPSCKDCVKKGKLLRESVSSIEWRAIQKVHEKEGKQRCSHCFKSKLLSEFYNQANRPSGKMAQCIDCFKNMNEDWWGDESFIQQVKNYNQIVEGLLINIAKLSPTDFEKLVGLLCEKMGFEDIVVTQGSGDKGIDVLCTYSNEFSSFKCAIQVKRWKNNVSPKPIRDFMGSIDIHTRGVFITSGGFGKTAREIKQQNKPLVDLVDGKQLADLLIEHEIGVRKSKGIIKLTKFTNFAD